MTTIATAPTTSASPSTTAVATTTTAEPIPCAFADVPVDGQITWIERGQLHATDGLGNVSCLLEGATTTATAVWSPSGDRAVLDGATVTAPDGPRPTGFAAGSSVSWSQPTGKALISVDPGSHRLIWHSSTADFTQDISFLARTDEAVYHPAGKAIVAVGVDENGQYGIWLASNRGEGRRVIVTIDDPSTPAHDLALSSDGTTLHFIHGIAHSLVMRGLGLFETGTQGRAEHDLAVSTVDSDVALRTGECDTSGSIVILGGPTTNLRRVPGSPFADAKSLQPVGWLGLRRLVILARDSGCDGPADVWTWSPTAGFEQIGSSWSSVSVRVARGPFEELPANIDEAAPG